MFYEEQVIDGILMCRTTPTGQWARDKSRTAGVINALLTLTDEERVHAFTFFCLNCGCNDPMCYCWNDE